MPLYHGFEIATDGAYEMHVEEDEKLLNQVLEELTAQLKEDGEEIETIAIGTVHGDSVQDAINNIRAGDWQYSQKC